MDDLPELPFEQMLNYMSFEEVIKLRAVSRRWCNMVDNYKVKSLCYSEVPVRHIYEKNRWARGAYAQNFIVSTRFESFFKTFGRSILSHLKRLRLYAPDLRAESPTAFTDALDSFNKLEELDLIGKWNPKSDSKPRELALSLPMLKSVRFERVKRIEKLTLNAPMLKKVKLNRSSFFLDLVHGESVECFHIEMGFKYVNVKSLKNLKTIYVGDELEINFHFLSDLEQLKEIHLIEDNDVPELFELNQQNRRADLKIYRYGYLLNGPNNPEMCWNPSRLTDEMPLSCSLRYAGIWRMAPEFQATILNRLTGLSDIILNAPVQDIDRFLSFLKTFNHIAYLQVDDCDQLQPLLDRLPEYSGLQNLDLLTPPSDYEFLFRLENLIYLGFEFSVDTETIRRALEKLPLLEYLDFYPDSLDWLFEIYIEGPIKGPKRFKVVLREDELQTCDLDAVIQFIQQKMTEERREQDDMEIDWLDWPNLEI